MPAEVTTGRVISFSDRSPSPRADSGSNAFDPESARGLGERLLKEITRPVVTSAGILEVGASIGLVIVVPAAGLPSNEVLMKQADLTMQEVKRGGGGVSLYGFNDEGGSS